MRKHQASDLETLVSLWGHPQVVHQMGSAPMSQPEVWKRILVYRGHWELFGFGFWIVEERSTGNFVGELGFGDFRRGIPALDGAPEAGWSLHPDQHGKGYAQEAMLRGFDWLRVNRGDVRTVCMISPTNVPSIRLATRLGFTETGEAEFKGPVKLYERFE